MSYVDGRYFHSVMHYLNEIGGTISHVPTYTLTAVREDNQSLMEVALHSRYFNTYQLKRINCVCMYLGNTYLSEICHPKGKTCCYNKIRVNLRLKLRMSRELLLIIKGVVTNSAFEFASDIQNIIIGTQHLSEQNQS